jgi:hypothetical protein
VINTAPEMEAERIAASSLRAKPPSNRFEVGKRQWEALSTSHCV